MSKAKKIKARKGPEQLRSDQQARDDPDSAGWHVGLYPLIFRAVLQTAYVCDPYINQFSICPGVG
jgi:hypothetical protein